VFYKSEWVYGSLGWGFYSTKQAEPIVIDFPSFGSWEVKVTLLGDKVTNAPQDVNYVISEQAYQSIPSETQDNKSYLNALIAVSEGEIDDILLNTIEVNGNPISNFDSQIFLTEKRLGTNTQLPIDGFEDVYTQYSVGAKLLKGSPYTHTTNGVSVEGFEITFTVPGLYTLQKDGGVLPLSITYTLEYKLHSASAWTSVGTITIRDCIQSSFVRKFRVDNLLAGQYDVRLTRTSDDPTFTQAGELYFTDISEIIYQNLAYPNTALLGFNMLATDKLSGSLPTITSIVRGIKVVQPKVVDSGGTELAYGSYYYDWDTQEYKNLFDGSTATWDGTTWVTKWSANPVWIFYDMLTNNRRGLGKFIATNIDVDDFVSMANYCDVLVPIEDGSDTKEKRFRLDVVIDSTQRALDLLHSLAVTFRGYVFYSEGKVKLVIDKEESPTQVFNMSNIELQGNKSGFTESFASLKTVPNVIEVQFANSAKDYDRDVISFSDETSIVAGDPIRKQSLNLLGIVRTSQAMRIAKWFMLSAKYCTRVVSFPAMIDAVASSCGDVINVAHDVPQWGLFGGRVVSGTTSSVTLDEAVVLAAGKTYEIVVRLNTDVIETRTITNAAGSHTVITVSSAFSSAPQEDDIATIGEQNIATKPFRIVSIERDSINKVNISAIEYDADIYDEEAGIVLPVTQYSLLSVNSPITGLVLTEGPFVG
jgi:predicted phage tail protein